MGIQCKIYEVERGKKAEKKINEWLKNIGNLNIKFITQTTKGSLLITSVFYE